MGEATTLLREFDFKKASVPEKLLVIKIQQAVIDKGLSDAAERFTTIEPVQDGIRPGILCAFPIPTTQRKPALGQPSSRWGGVSLTRSWKTPFWA